MENDTRGTEWVNQQARVLAAEIGREHRLQLNLRELICIETPSTGPLRTLHFWCDGHGTMVDFTDGEVAACAETEEGRAVVADRIRDRVCAWLERVESRLPHDG